MNGAGWDHRFVFESNAVGTQSLPVIKASKPYISKNGSVVKSVLRTNARETKRKKGTRGRDQHRDLEIVTSSLTPVQKRKVTKPLPSLANKISARQRGKINGLRSRARPLSLPLLRHVQSPLPLGMEKSYSARDSTSRTSMLQIDMSLLDVDSSKEKQQWQEFQEITEDREVNAVCRLSRLFCIGKGSSAYVYKSVLFPSLQVVADKVIVVASQEKSSQLIRELNSLRTLLSDDGGRDKRHPHSKNIVRLLEVYPNPRDGTISVCLEYMAGGSLQDVLLRGGCQDEVVLAALSRQVMAGVSYLHSHRHIHRDIKPGNILIGSGDFLKGEAVVKLSDFGISKELEKGHSLADSFLGTFHYMSPERIAGQDYSFSSDIWGCGLSILAVAMGCYPFSKRSKSDTDGASQTVKRSLRRGAGRGGGEKEDEHLSQKAEVTGVQDHGGYWHILQAISQRPSLKKLLGSNNKFSSHFCNFLSVCLHRDKDQRSSANALLASHPFLVGEKKQELTHLAPSSDVDASEVPGEYCALRAFVVQCCTIQREKLKQSQLSTGLFAPIRPRACDRIFLENVNVVLRVDGDCGDVTDANSECLQYRYNQESTEDMNNFFSVFFAFKEFVSRSWENENEHDLKDTSAAEISSCRVSALRHLLDSTLCMPVASPSSSKEGGGELALPSRSVIECTRISPCISPLFDQCTIHNFSEQLHIPVRFVKICFRDFVMHLLKIELQRLSEVESVLKTTDADVAEAKGQTEDEKCEMGKDGAGHLSTMTMISGNPEVEKEGGISGESMVSLNGGEDFESALQQDKMCGTALRTCNDSDHATATTEDDVDKLSSHEEDSYEDDFD